MAASETSSLLFTVVRDKAGCRLVCTLWNGSSFIDYKEHELKEQPSDLTCAGMDSLCAGFKRSYELINVHTGSTMNITDCGRAGGPPCSVLLPPTKAPQEASSRLSPTDVENKIQEKSKQGTSPRDFRGDFWAVEFNVFLSFLVLTL